MLKIDPAIYFRDLKGRLSYLDSVHLIYEIHMYKLWEWHISKFSQMSKVLNHLYTWELMKKKKKKKKWELMDIVFGETQILWVFYNSK